MEGQCEHTGAHAETLPPTNVRVLKNDEELAAAVARAAEGAKRLQDRLEARAARDAWMAEQAEHRVGWRRFVRAGTERMPLVTPSAAPTPEAAADALHRARSSPPAA